MANKLLSTLAAARLLGVGPTSVKRWADAGILNCVRTPGGHRRFLRSSVESLLVPQSDQPVSNEENTNRFASTWIARLVSSDGPEALDPLLEDMYAETGAWWRVAEALGGVLEEMGERWRNGTLSVVQEHIASERLARLLARTADSIRLPARAPVALLVAAEGEEHTLGLSQLELCLREAGYATRWAGRKTPIDRLAAHLERGDVDLLAVSASAHAKDHAALEEQATKLSEACQKHGVELLLGGQGAWPDVLHHGYRVRSYQHLTNILAEFRATAG